MPKRKSSKKQAESDSDSGSENASSEDRSPAKKQKGETEANSWDLGNDRFVKLTKYKRMWYIHIRQFYGADGNLKPGKKGIMLNIQHWQKLKGSVDEIDEAVNKKIV